MIVLKRLEDARRDGDDILAVIAGGAVNHDGRSNGMLAPNPDAQEAVLRKAYKDAGIDPRSVDYVEAHGTGTTSAIRTRPTRWAASSAAVAPPTSRPCWVR